MSSGRNLADANQKDPPPEERAKVVMSWLRQECSDAICTHLDCPSCGCMAYLALAIREAEDAALERAAQLALEGHDEAWGNPAEQHGWLKAAECARSLKHNKD